MGETCATCTHFIGSGDWGLCCDLKYDLCYSCTPKCNEYEERKEVCLLYTSPSPRDISGSRMPSSA